MNTDLDSKTGAASADLTQLIIGCAYEVSNTLGCGFLESVYEASLVVELEKEGLAVERQKVLEVQYKGITVGRYVADLIIERQLIVEVKALSGLTRQHQAQLLNYLAATGLTLGLLLNFGNPRIEIRRMINN